MSIPPQIVVQRPVERLARARRGAGARRGGPVEIRAAERGDKRRILELAERNARLALDQEKLRDERRRQHARRGARRAAGALGLDAPPLRIECFDISNLMGTNTVASMVVFEGGAPKKSDYRRFTIRDASTASRRLRRDGGGAGAPPGAVGGPARPLAARPRARRELRRAAEPGRDRRRQGQLSAGLRALGGFRERGVAVVALAKRIEEVFIPGARAPLVLDHDTPELQLLQRSATRRTASRSPTTASGATGR